MVSVEFIEYEWYSSWAVAIFPMFCQLGFWYILSQNAKW